MTTSVRSADVPPHSLIHQYFDLILIWCKLYYLLLFSNPCWQVEAREVGTPDTPDYRVFFYNTAGKKISPWHDIALTEPGTRIEQGVLRYVVEIPKGYTHHTRTHAHHTPL